MARLIDRLKDTSFLDLTLRGFQLMLKKELDILPTLTIAENYLIDVKEKLLANGHVLTPPYAWLFLNGITTRRDEVGNYVMSREGMFFPMKNSVERAMVEKVHTFPMDIGLELHYVDSNNKNLLLVAQVFSLLSVINQTYFQIKIGHNYSYGNRLVVPEDQTITPIQLDNEQFPGMMELTLNIVLKSYIGYFTKVASIQSKAPIIEMEVVYPSLVGNRCPKSVSRIPITFGNGEEDVE